MTDATKPTKPSWPFASIPTESSFTKSNAFNGVNHNKSIQSLRKREAGDTRTDPFSLRDVAPRTFSTYSRAEAVEPFIKPTEESDVQV